MHASRLVVLLSLFACASSETTPSGDAGDTHVVTGGSVRFNVNGAARTGTGAVAVRESAGTVFNSVAAASPDGATLSISWTGTGTGAITTDTQQLIVMWIQPDQTSYLCAAGVAGSTCAMTLSSYDQGKVRAAGTFSGTLALTKGSAAPTLAIAAGAFDL